MDSPSCSLMFWPLHCMAGCKNRGEHLLNSDAGSSSHEDWSIILLKCKLRESLSYYWNISPRTTETTTKMRRALTLDWISGPRGREATCCTQLEDESRDTLVWLNKTTSSHAPLWERENSLYSHIEDCPKVRGKMRLPTMKQRLFYNSLRSYFRILQLVYLNSQTSRWAMRSFCSYPTITEIMRL